MTGAPPDYAEEGRKLFSGPCDFIWAAMEADKLPPATLPEIAFAGRSNVGKSSLVNALTGRKTLARTSHTPGRTQELIFFDLNNRLRLVDMPGYGYAAVSKEKSGAWGALIADYLRGRPGLMRVFILIDGRHGFKEVDMPLMDMLDKAAVSYQIVLTKKDEVKKADIEDRIASTRAALAKRPAAHPDILFVSSHKSEGMTELRAGIAELLAQRGA
jgi:GTP-binding protein